jgi:hypothetical protein
VIEFNNIIAKCYVDFVTNGDEGELPIVFHTTEKVRNRNLGQYHVFVHNGHEVPSVAIANIADEPAERIDHRFSADYFWNDVCKPWDREGRCTISLRVMVVGHLAFTRYPKVFTGKSLSRGDSKDIHGMHITPDHKVRDLFGDLPRFQENVRNIFRHKMVAFRNYPEYPEFNNDESKQRELRRKYELFEHYQLHGVNGDGVDEQLEERIIVAIAEGNLSAILKLGLHGMTSDLVSYLIDAHQEFVRRIEIASSLENVETQSSYRKKAANLAKEWCQPDFILRF